MQRAWIALAVVAVLGAGARSARADAGDVALVAGGAADAGALRHVTEMLDLPPVVRAIGAVEGSSERAWIAAACALPETYVVEIAAAAGRVRVVRCEDEMLLTRVFDARAAAAAPYAVALVAVELLELAREAPLAEREVATPRPARRSPRPDPLRLSVGPSAGAAVLAGLGGSVVLLSPVVGAEALIGTARGRLRLGAGIEGVPIAQLERTLAGDQVSVRYRRSELALRPMLAWRLGDSLASASLLVWIDASLAWVSAIASLDGRTVGSHRRLDVSAGPALALRVELGAGLHLQFGAGVRWSSDPVRYRVRGVPSIDEGDAQLRSMITVGWATR